MSTIKILSSTLVRLYEVCLHSKIFSTKKLYINSQNQDVNIKHQRDHNYNPQVKKKTVILHISHSCK